MAFIDSWVTIGEYQQLSGLSYGAIKNRVHIGLIETKYIKGSSRPRLRLVLATQKEQDAKKAAIAHNERQGMIRELLRRKAAMMKKVAEMDAQINRLSELNKD